MVLSKASSPPSAPNPKYPLEPFLRVVTVGLETMKVVNGLQRLGIPITVGSAK